MNKILLLLIATSSCFSLMSTGPENRKPAALTMDDVEMQLTNRQDSHTNMERCATCFINGCVLPICIASTCIAETATCPCSYQKDSGLTGTYYATGTFFHMWRLAIQDRN
jgi:hypothetical protein